MKVVLLCGIGPVGSMLAKELRDKGYMVILDEESTSQSVDIRRMTAAPRNNFCRWGIAESSTERIGFPVNVAVVNEGITQAASSRHVPEPAIDTFVIEDSHNPLSPVADVVATDPPSEIGVGGYSFRPLRTVYDQEFDVLWASREGSSSEPDTLFDVYRDQYQRTALIKRMKAAFRDAQNEVFESGMNSEFSEALYSAIRDYGEIAVSAIAAILESEAYGMAVQGEALRLLGDCEDAEAHRARLHVLVDYLQS